MAEITDNLTLSVNELPLDVDFTAKHREVLSSAKAYDRLGSPVPLML